MPAVTASMADILSDCPEVVFPTVSTHGRGRLGVSAEQPSFSSVTRRDALSAKCRPELSQKKICAGSTLSL